MHRIMNTVQALVIMGAFQCTPNLFAADLTATGAGAKHDSATGAWQIYVNLTASLAEDKICMPGECSLREPSRFNSTIPVVSSGWLKDDHSILILSLPPGTVLDSGGAYYVTIANLVFTGQNVGDPNRPIDLIQAKVKMTLKDPDDQATRFVPCIKLPTPSSVDRANGRDDANFYFGGQATHSRGKDFVGTYDFKADLSTRLKHGMCGVFIDLKGGNDPNGDPDSLNSGVKLDYPLKSWNYSPLLNELRWSHVLKLESTEDFTYKNFIYASDLTLLFTTLPTPHRGSWLQIYLRPRAGVEVGHNLGSNVKEADGRSIARLKAGTALMFYFPVHALALQDVTLETEYDRRWPLLKEVRQDETMGVFSAATISTKPRDYLKETLTVNLTKYIGVTVAYEYGSLPPKFKFLDSKFTIGLSVKAAFK